MITKILFRRRKFLQLANFVAEFSRVLFSCFILWFSPAFPKIVLYILHAAARTYICIYVLYVTCVFSRVFFNKLPHEYPIECLRSAVNI